MKRLLMYMLVIGGLLYLPVWGGTVSEQLDAKAGIAFEYTPQEGSVEELYKDIIVTQLEPVISEAVEKQYGKPLLYALYDVRFMEIKREAYRGYSFLVKLRVQPFVGAHNIIGEDELIISITPGQTKLERFEHIKSYPLPDYRP